MSPERRIEVNVKSPLVDASKAEAGGDGCNRHGEVSDYARAVSGEPNIRLVTVTTPVRECWEETRYYTIETRPPGSFADTLVGSGQQFGGCGNDAATGSLRAVRRGKAKRSAVCLLSTLVLACLSATPSWAVAGRLHRVEPHMLLEERSCLSLREAIEQVRRQYNGRILSAETRRVSGNREVHHIKVLTDSGKVKAVRIPGCGRRLGMTTVHFPADNW